jgi:hypothetical protein
LNNAVIAVIAGNAENGRTARKTNRPRAREGGVTEDGPHKTLGLRKSVLRFANSGFD